MSPAGTTEMGDPHAGGHPRELADPSQAARPLPPRPSARSLPARRSLATVSESTEAIKASPIEAPAGRPPLTRKPRPDPGPLRIALGLSGMATASALVSAFLGSALGANGGAGTGVGTTETVVVDTPTSPDTVKHITRIVQLGPGETAPPKAIVQQAPAPTPRVVTVTTRQSGK